MSEFQEGRVAATFQVGARIEDTKEAYEKEIIGIDGAKHALIGGMKALDEYRKAIQKEGVDGKVPIKETDTALKYVTGCIELLQKLLGEAEGKRFAAAGAIDVLKRVIADTKKLWDEEQQKLKKIQEFEAISPKNMKERPVGYMPKEHPIEEYKKETDRQSTIETYAVEEKSPKKSPKRTEVGKPSRAQ